MRFERANLLIVLALIYAVALVAGLVGGDLGNAALSGALPAVAASLLILLAQRRIAPRAVAFYVLGIILTSAILLTIFRDIHGPSATGRTAGWRSARQAWRRAARCDFCGCVDSRVARPPVLSLARQRHGHELYYPWDGATTLRLFGCARRLRVGACSARTRVRGRAQWNRIFASPARRRSPQKWPPRSLAR